MTFHFFQAKNMDFLWYTKQCDTWNVIPVCKHSLLGKIIKFQGAYRQK